MRTNKTRLADSMIYEIYHRGQLPRMVQHSGRRDWRGRDNERPTRMHYRDAHWRGGTAPSYHSALFENHRRAAQWRGTLRNVKKISGSSVSFFFGVPNFRLRCAGDGGIDSTPMNGGKVSNKFRSEIGEKTAEEKSECAPRRRARANRWR